MDSGTNTNNTGGTLVEEKYLTYFAAGGVFALFGIAFLICCVARTVKKF